MPGGAINNINDGFIAIEFKYADNQLARALDKGDAYPYTNTGMLASKRNIIPEFYYENMQKLKADDILKKYDADGKPLGTWMLKPDKQNPKLLQFIKQ